MGGPTQEPSKTAWKTGEPPWNPPVLSQTGAGLVLYPEGPRWVLGLGERVGQVGQETNPPDPWGSEVHSQSCLMEK